MSACYKIPALLSGLNHYEQMVQSSKSDVRVHSLEEEMRDEIKMALLDHFLDRGPLREKEKPEMLKGTKLSNYLLFPHQYDSVMQCWSISLQELSRLNGIKNLLIDVFSEKSDSELEGVLDTFRSLIDYLKILDRDGKSTIDSFEFLKLLVRFNIKEKGILLNVLDSALETIDESALREKVSSYNSRLQDDDLDSDMLLSEFSTVSTGQWDFYAGRKCHRNSSEFELNGQNRLNELIVFLKKQSDDEDILTTLKEMKLAFYHFKDARIPIEEYQFYSQILACVLQKKSRETKPYSSHGRTNKRPIEVSQSIITPRRSRPVPKTGR